MAVGDYPVDMGDGSEESRRALWDMAFGLLALVDEEPDPRTPPLRGESFWVRELAERHVAGEVATAELSALVDLHYLDVRDSVRLVEARADSLAARMVSILLDGRPALSPRGLVAVLDRLYPEPNERVRDFGSEFRTAEIDEPEAILGGRGVRYVPSAIVEDVLSSALARFRQSADAPGIEAQRLLGAALLDLVVSIWRARPFGRPDALVTAVFLLLVLKDQQVMVNPAPFARHAAYFRDALVRACFSDPGAGIRESTRFIGMFLANLFAGGDFALRDSDTACRELLAVRERRVVPKRDRGNYLLKLLDNTIAALRFGQSRSGDVSIEALEVVESRRAVLPLNLLRSFDSVELERFIKSRVMSRGRAYRGDILGAYGISGARTWAIVHFSRGISPCDSYSIVKEDDALSFDDYSTFGNAHDAVLQEVAFTGRPIKGGVRSALEGVPVELATGGNGPKAWRITEKGRLQLCKAGAAGKRSAAAELLALRVAAAIGAPVVGAEADEWFGIPCTAVSGFASVDISFVPFALAVSKGELDACTLGDALGFYRSVGRQAEESFRKMLVLDALLANAGRTPLDHGVMRDVMSGEVFAAAPLFDFDQALFALDAAAAGASPDELARRARGLRGLFGSSLEEQARFALDGAGDGLFEMLERARTLDAADFDAPDAAMAAALCSIPLQANHLFESAG